MNSVIVYECMPSTLTTWVPALPPDGEWVRVIPCALPDECVVSSRRTEDPGSSFVDLETEYDLKSFGPGDVWFRGPAIIVSNAMVTALEAFSMGGFTTLPLEHATPFAPSIPAPVRLVPTHSLPTVGAGVALHPASHPRGRSYGYHGRPSEPLTLRGPTLDPRHVYGSPWFATASLPFQCLILSAWFVERFRELHGRFPQAQWTSCPIEHAEQPPLRGSLVVASTRSTATTRLAPMERAALVAHCRVNTAEFEHHVHDALTLFSGAVGLFPDAVTAEALSHRARCRATNIPELVSRSDANHPDRVEQLGYPRPVGFDVIGWVRGAMPTLLMSNAAGACLRVSASGELVSRYPSVDAWLSDTMRDMEWAWRNSSHTSHWFGW